MPKLKKLSEEGRKRIELIEKAEIELNKLIELYGYDIMESIIRKQHNLIELRQEKQQKEDYLRRLRARIKFLETH